MGQDHEWTFTGHAQINEVLVRFLEEKHPFSKVHRLIDLFECIIKTHTAVIIAGYFEIRQVSDTVKGLLAEGLITPSLGTWQLFSRTIMEELAVPRRLLPRQWEELSRLLSEAQRKKLGSYYELRQEEWQLKRGIAPSEIRTLRSEIFAKNDYAYSPSFGIPGFYSYFFSFDRALSGEIALGNGRKVPNVIAFRNRYAHGATPGTESCLADLEAYQPVLKRMLDAFWLKETFVQVEESPTLVVPDGKRLSLIPILCGEWVDGRLSLFFLNDLKRIKKKEVSLLHYPEALHHASKSLYPQLVSVLPVEEWKQYRTKAFEDTITRLSEQFYGRQREQDTILSFLRVRDRGVFWLTGSPGIGKSALIAKVLLELQAQDEESLADGTSGGQTPYVIKFFIRRNSIYNSPFRLLEHLNEELESLHRTGIPKGNTPEEMKSTLQERLRAIEQKPDARKTIIFIDGVDEGVDTGLVSVLPNDTFNGILFIYSSRRIPEMDELFHRTPVEERRWLDLSGLQEEDIRALVYAVCDKYACIRSPEYVERVLTQSGGNPLYVTLLCRAIEEKELHLGQLDRMPDTIERFYDDLLLRFLKRREDGLLIREIALFAAAEEDLTCEHVERMLALQPLEAEEAVQGVMEALQENSEHRRRYRLFHDSLREYIVKYRKSEWLNAHQAIIRTCREWTVPERRNHPVTVYAYHHLAKHMTAVGDRDGLLALADNADFTQAQLTETGGLTSSLELFQLAMRSLGLQAEDVQRRFRLAETAARLHKQWDSRLIDSMNDWSAWREAGDSALSQLKFRKSSEQFILYLKFMAQTLRNPLMSDEAKHERLTEIMEQLDRSLIRATLVFNWCDMVSLHVLMSVMMELIRLGVGVEPLHARSDLQNLDPSVIRMELSSFDMRDPVAAQAIEPIFTYHPYGPVLSILIEKYGQCGRFEDARRIVDLYRSEEDRIIARAQLAVLLAGHDRRMEAEAELEACEVDAEQLSLDYMRVCALTAIAEAWARLECAESAARLADRCSQLLEAMPAGRDTAAGFRGMAGLYVRLGRTEEAESLLNEPISDTWNRANTYISWSDQEWEAKPPSLAKLKTYADEIERLAASAWDPRDKRVCLRLAALQYIRLQETDRALAILERIDDKWNRLYVLRHASYAFADNRGKAYVYEQALVQNSVDYALLVGCGLAYQLSVQGKWAEAVLCYDELINLYRNEPIRYGERRFVPVHTSQSLQPLPETTDQEELSLLLEEAEACEDDCQKSLRLGQLSGLFYKRGALAEAQAYLAKATESSRRIQNGYNRSYAYAELLKEKIRQGRAEVALKKLDVLEYAWFKAAVYHQLAIEWSRSRLYKQLFTMIRGQTEKLFMITMLEQTAALVAYEDWGMLLRFVSEQLPLEEVQTEVLGRMTEGCARFGDKMAEAAAQMLPFVSYNRMLLERCLAVYTESKKQTAHESPLAALFAEAELLMKSLTDEEDKQYLAGLIRRVQSGKMKPAGLEAALQEMREAAGMS